MTRDHSITLWIWLLDFKWWFVTRNLYPKEKIMSLLMLKDTLAYIVQSLECHSIKFKENDDTHTHWSIPKIWAKVVNIFLFSVHLLFSLIYSIEFLFPSYFFPTYKSLNFKFNYIASILKSIWKWLWYDQMHLILQARMFSIIHWMCPPLAWRSSLLNIRQGKSSWFHINWQGECIILYHQDRNKTLNLFIIYHYEMQIYYTN